MNMRMPRILDAASQFKTATKRIEAQKQAQLLTPSFLAIFSPEKAMKVKGEGCDKGYE